MEVQPWQSWGGGKHGILECLWTFGQVLQLQPSRIVTVICTPMSESFCKSPAHCLWRLANVSGMLAHFKGCTTKWEPWWERAVLLSSIFIMIWTWYGCGLRWSHHTLCPIAPKETWTWLPHPPLNCFYILWSMQYWIVLLYFIEFATLPNHKHNASDPTLSHTKWLVHSRNTMTYFSWNLGYYNYTHKWHIIHCFL